ncbi:MAG TPA: phosphoribosylanthranilate isomerase [Verrucomicrobiae bacterium]|jgi:phosphoribosylanthranilate isomerase
MSVFVKICGITSEADARVAVDAGADAVGFMFHQGSPRFVTPELVEQVIAALPARVAKVGVFVNVPPDMVRAVAARCGLDTLQFHGDESPGYCGQFAPLTVWKAIAVKDRESLSRLPPYEIDAWLLDAHVPGQRGGTGAMFNWDLAVDAKSLGRPILLAGGLTPANVADAVRHVQPWGVDVSSGVESAPGRKDHAKLRAFIQAARAAA